MISITCEFECMIRCFLTQTLLCSKIIFRVSHRMAKDDSPFGWSNRSVCEFVDFPGFANPHNQPHYIFLEILSRREVSKRNTDNDKYTRAKYPCRDICIHLCTASHIFSIFEWGQTLEPRKGKVGSTKIWSVTFAKTSVVFVVFSVGSHAGKKSTERFFNLAAKTVEDLGFDSPEGCWYWILWSRMSEFWSCHLCGA